MIRQLAKQLSAAGAQARDALRKFMVRRGVALFRVAPSVGVPPSLVQYLLARSRRGRPVAAVISFDDEPQIQKELLGIFPPARVTFVARATAGSDPAGFPPSASPKQPPNTFWIEVDGETYDLWKLGADLPWLFEAEVILVRCTLGHFWSGPGDLRGLEQFLRGHGFKFFDVLEYFKPHFFNASLGRVVLVFENQKTIIPAGESSRCGTAVDDQFQRRRIHEALAFLSNPIARSSTLVRLAGRGSFGFAGGVLNPGAIAEGGNLMLLARGETIPWAVAKLNTADYLPACRPVMLVMDEQRAVGQVSPMTVTKAGGMAGVRLEDFRLFRYGGQLFANHSKVVMPAGRPPGNNPVQLEALQIRVGISRFDAANHELTYLGDPILDLPLERAEKNWVFFEHQKELYLIYSFNPFHLLRASRWPQLDFKTVHRKPLALPDGGEGIKFRNSANPVDYDANYFLHMVHKVYPDKKYVFWAVLIEKSSLLPKMISARPLVCGWKSAPVAIVYACSMVVRRDEVLVFGGLNDSGMGYWKIDRSELDQNWMPLN